MILTFISNGFEIFSTRGDAPAVIPKRADKVRLEQMSRQFTGSVVDVTFVYDVFASSTVPIRIEITLEEIK